MFKKLLVILTLFMLIPLSIAQVLSMANGRQNLTDDYLVNLLGGNSFYLVEDSTFADSASGTFVYIGDGISCFPVKLRGVSSIGDNNSISWHQQARSAAADSVQFVLRLWGKDVRGRLIEPQRRLVADSVVNTPADTGFFSKAIDFESVLDSLCVEVNPGAAAGVSAGDTLLIKNILITIQ